MRVTTCYVSHLQRVAPFLITFLMQSVANANVDKISPTYDGWKCTGCPESGQASIFEQVKRASSFGDRYIYFPINTTWINEVSTSPSVHIVYNFECTENSLNQFSSDVHHLYTKSENNNEMYIIACNEVVHIANNNKMESKTSPDQNIESYRIVIDDFFAKNPCWYPMQEPTLQSIRQQGRGSSIRNDLLLLIHFPHQGFHATCMLFEAIVARQFPQKCIYDRKSMTKFDIANIG